MIEAQVSRRDVLKFSALGAAVVALPLERAVRAKTVSQIAASKLPAPYTLPFAISPGSRPRSSDTACPARAPPRPARRSTPSAARRSR